jgi:hypothetical protein
MHTHTCSTDIIDHSIHESVMEIIDLAHIYSVNVPGVSAYWRNIYNDFIGHMGMEQRQMEYLPIYRPIYSRGSCMEIIKHAHIYSSNLPGFSAYWRSIYNEPVEQHALAPVEQQKMEYTELNYFFGAVEQLPPVWKNRN